ncbi:PTS sugar transporter subunit IIA [Paenibacillus validus]|uniref:Mannitol-specific phosphotransferase enzyme IIA component n=1 Tax=Paenibacillus validus TaxID=44253 RepID=A0A7X3CRF6_9BACL|nr:MULTISPECIES: PTS sugar transporter subunit IIA [Paenibacillus]MED4604061.1 PTS sugar transporter subunit IIA [Paenibacillus validus]MED4606068.1 PTS sugar transporter subunit IIA [Paenibacillus validus]MUG69671.1 PTS mannitol transporter subunit IIA [Paenibacillus validus]
MSIVSQDKVRLNVKVNDKYEAIRIAGQLLVDAGHVPSEYVDKMIERERSLSTYMGGGLAIPHGTNEAKALIKSTGLSVVIVPDGVDFGEGERANLIIGIAAAGDEHLEILTNVAMLVSEEEDMKRILNASSEAELVDIFESGLDA